MTEALVTYKCLLGLSKIRVNSFLGLAHLGVENVNKFVLLALDLGSLISGLASLLLGVCSILLFPLGLRL